MATDITPLFDELWDYNNPEETEHRLRALLPDAEAPSDLSYHVQLLTQFARTQSLQGQYDEAHQILDLAESLLNRELTVARIRYLLERGRTYNSAGERDRAKSLFIKAWEEASEAGQTFYAVDAAHMVAIAEQSSDEQLAWNLKAIEMAEGSNNARTRQWLGSLYNNVGWTYFEMGHYEKALTIFEKALASREEETTPGKESRVRIARWCVARTLRSLNRVEEALSMQQAMLADNESRGEEDGYVYEELGECLLFLGREPEAQPYLRKAYELLSQDSWLVTHEPDRLERLDNLSSD